MQNPIQTIGAIVFDPVGSLAEFPPEPFVDIATRVFSLALAPGVTGSQAYWDVLNLLTSADQPLRAQDRAVIEACECRAVDLASVYEDAAPALSELASLGIRLIAASSLSEAALSRFLERSSLGGWFADRWSRDMAGGVVCEPIAKAIAARFLEADRVMVLADTADGLRAAKHVGANAILMMNDPDEAMRLTAQNPDGGIVSLHELPDFVRLVAAANARR
jgi:phosphoglycolate phosphatase-like HAD superfamily hydrolase